SSSRRVGGITPSGRATESVSTDKRDREVRKNDEPGSGGVVASEGASARRSWRRRLFELVRAHGPGGDRGRNRAHVGADPFSQELDSVALRRTRAGLLAGGTDPGRPHRIDRALGGVAIGCCQAQARVGDRRRRRRQLPGGDATVHEALGGSPLDARLTFETFVVGRSNTLAQAAAKQVAVAKRGDAVMFNPL